MIFERIYEEIEREGLFGFKFIEYHFIGIQENEYGDFVIKTKFTSDIKGFENCIYGFEIETFKELSEALNYLENNYPEIKTSLIGNEL